VEYCEKARGDVDQWRGLCLRAYDYSTVSLYQVDQLPPIHDATADHDPETEEEDPEIEEMRLK